MIESPRPSRPRRSFAGILIRVAFALVVAVLFFFVIEGCSSTAIVVHDMITEPQLAERLHTVYDEQLGWVNEPNFSDPNLYGPGLGLTTNSQGFRNTQDFTPEVPEGKLRVICSGDSFTLGYGVADHQTWCAQLEKLDPQLQTVNMGQGGYGIDQAYLWYEREKKWLEHDVHIFAFITHDFDRMASTSFCGYGKPVLQVEGGRPVVTNVPVPRTSYVLGWMFRNGERLQQLSSVRVARRLLLPPDVGAAPPAELDDYLRKTSVAVFNALAEEHRRRGSTLLLVHLPTEQEYFSTTHPWHDFLHEQAEQHGWIYVDLLKPCKQLPESRFRSLFLDAATVHFQGAAGHLDPEGNRYIAELLYQRMLEIPEIADRLAEEG